MATGRVSDPAIVVQNFSVAEEKANNKQKFEKSLSDTIDTHWNKAGQTVHAVCKSDEQDAYVMNALSGLISAISNAAKEFDDAQAYRAILIAANQQADIGYGGYVAALIATFDLMIKEETILSELDKEPTPERLDDWADSFIKRITKEIADIRDHFPSKSVSLPGGEIHSVYRALDYADARDEVRELVKTLVEDAKEEMRKNTGTFNLDELVNQIKNNTDEIMDKYRVKLEKAEFIWTWRESILKYYQDKWSIFGPSLANLNIAVNVSNLLARVRLTIDTQAGIQQSEGVDLKDKFVESFKEAHALVRAEYDQIVSKLAEEILKNHMSIKNWKGWCMDYYRHRFISLNGNDRERCDKSMQMFSMVVTHGAGEIEKLLSNDSLSQDEKIKELKGIIRGVDGWVDAAFA